MAFAIPSQEHQQFIFDYLRSDIDRDLREAGIDQLVAAQGFVIPEAGNEILFDDSFSKIVVSRHIGYTSAEATTDRDLDPLAEAVTVEHEVGVRNEKRQGTHVVQSSYTGLLVSMSVLGEPRKAAGIGLEMSTDQLAVVTTAVSRLTEAKRKAYLPFLTKTLIKLSLAGD